MYFVRSGLIWLLTIADFKWLFDSGLDSRAETKLCQLRIEYGGGLVPNPNFTLKLIGADFHARARPKPRGLL
jgi:hypothetical protein